MTPDHPRSEAAFHIYDVNIILSSDDFRDAVKSFSKPEIRSWVAWKVDVVSPISCATTQKPTCDTEVIFLFWNDFPCGNATSPKLDFVRSFLDRETAKSAQNRWLRAFGMGSTWEFRFSTV
jgi:hypothetical protein